jgi:2,4-diaminopentanoate dehydrogenase
VSTRIRILVWGPGGLGNICIREAIRLSEFELVGVLAYSPDKNGVDAGLLAGVNEIGVSATTDLDVAAAIEADAVVHLARDFGRYDAVAGIETFLRAGSNVISVHPFHHPDVMRHTSAPDDTLARIESACTAGGSTFHATGIHPEFIANRLAPTLTGICTDVRKVMIFENWDMSQFNTATLKVIGFGKPPEHMESNPAVAQMTDNYCLHNLYGLAASLGVQLDHTESAHEYAPAPTELSFPTLTIAAGTVGRLTHTWYGYSLTEDAPIVAAEVNWMLGRNEMVPPGFDPNHYYGVRVQGTPSLSVGLSITRPQSQGPTLDGAEDPASEPGYYGAVATCLQAAPRVIAAAPGWLGPVRPPLHWSPDLRTLATP